MFVFSAATYEYRVVFGAQYGPGQPVYWKDEYMDHNSQQSQTLMHSYDYLVCYPSTKFRINIISFMLFNEVLRFFSEIEIIYNVTVIFYF